MTSTPEPSAGQTPPKLQFAETADDGDNINAKLVALIIVVVLLIAGGVTAAIVFGKEETAPKPPQPGPPGQIVGMPRPDVAPHGIPVNVSLTSSGTPLASETLLAVSGKPVEVVEGVSLTPASGWTIEKQDKGVVMLMSGDKNAMLLVAAGVTDSKDAAAVLDADMQKFVENFGMKNVKVTKPKTGTMDSKNFQESVSRGFTADAETQQGTVSLVGMFAELMNTSTRMSAFIVYQAPGQDEYDATAAEADKMISSML